MKKLKNIIFYMLVVTLLITGISTKSYAQYEGGYCGNDPTTPGVVWNFIKHFSYEQYYWACGNQFTYNNNNRVDLMHFAYYCGHGAPWYIGYYSNCAGSGSSSYINLATAGYSSHKGYGDRNLNFIVFHSCKVIPSPIETSNWWQNWVSESDDIFDGLHMALGFRTYSLISTAPGIANFYGTRMAGVNYVLWSWFDAINAKGNHSSGYDYGCAVMYPPAQNDKYNGTMIVDPPENHTWLTAWYQY